MTQPEHGDNWRERLERWSLDERVAQAWNTGGRNRTLQAAAMRAKVKVNSAKPRRNTK